MIKFPSAAHLRFSYGFWRRRLIFWLGGVVVGLAAAFFAFAADAAQDLFRHIIHFSSLFAFAMAPLGLALSVWLTRRFFVGAQGSGIPQAMAARQVTDVNARKVLLSLRIAVGKIGLTILGLACGASIGREGPTVQVGASILLAFGRASPKRLRGLILAGGAAGVAAAFNTPLAGIVFAIEEMARNFEHETSGIVLVAVVIAGVTASAFLGDYTYFGHTSASLQDYADWLTVGVAGVGGGLLGGIFSALVVGGLTVGLPGRAGRLMKAQPIWFAAACGLGLAVIGLMSGGTTYGTGYTEAKLLVEGAGDMPLTFGPLKMISTLLSTVSGIPGGIFAPSLSVGAGFGADLAKLLPLTSLAKVVAPTAAGAVVLLGMVSYFSGVVQAPITAFVIVMEMTDNHHMIIPLILASVLASGTSRLVCRKPIYLALADRYVAAATASSEKSAGPVSETI